MELTIKARTANKLGQRERRAPSYLTWRDGFELSDDLYRGTLKVAKGARRYQAKNGTTKTRVLYLFIRRSDGPDILANLHTANWEKGEERARPIVRKAIAAGCLPADHGAALHYAPKRKATRPVCVMVDRRIGQGKYLLKALKLDGSFGYICLDVEEGEPDAWELVKDRSRVVVADWLGRELISPNFKPAKTYGPGGLDANFATEARRLAAQKWFAEKCRVESGRATRYGANVEPLLSKRPPVDRATRLAKISEIADLPAPKRAAACEVAVQLGLGDREAIDAMLELELMRRGNVVPPQTVLPADGERRPHLKQRPRLSLDQIAGAAPGVPLRPPIPLELQDKWSLQVSTDKPPPGFGAKFAYMAKIAGIFLVHINSKDGKCCPSYETIKAEAACSKQTAIDMTKLLEWRGHLGVERPARHGKGHHNRYTLLLKPDRAAAKGLPSGDLFDGVKGLDSGDKRSSDRPQKVFTAEAVTPEDLEPQREGERPSVARAPAPDPTEKKRSPKGARLPADWRPSQDDIAFAASKAYPPAEIDRIAEMFRYHWLENDVVKMDWAAAWRKWVLRERSFDDTRKAEGGPRRTGGTAPFKAREKPRVATVAPNLTNEQWLKVLVQFRISYRWNEATLGPKPNEPGCFAPKELWEEAGLVDDTIRSPKETAK